VIVKQLPAALQADQQPIEWNLLADHAWLWAAQAGVRPDHIAYAVVRFQSVWWAVRRLRDGALLRSKASRGSALTAGLASGRA